MLKSSDAFIACYLTKMEALQAFHLLRRDDCHLAPASRCLFAKRYFAALEIQECKPTNLSLE
jgi:hypothetical protein